MDSELTRMQHGNSDGGEGIIGIKGDGITGITEIAEIAEIRHDIGIDQHEHNLGLQDGEA